MVRSVEDRALVAAIREGNSVGLAGAYDTYGDALFSFCVSMLHDRSSAEEAVRLRRRAVAVPAPDPFGPAQRAARGMGRDDERRDAGLRRSSAQRTSPSARRAGEW